MKIFVAKDFMAQFTNKRLLVVYNPGMKKMLGLIVLTLIALPALSRDFSIHQVMGKSARQVDAAIGKPLSIGEGGTFREYGTKRSGWYVRFTGGKSTKATVTFRTAFAKPEAALEAIDLKVGKLKPTKVLFLSRRWEKLEGLKNITVRSLDGKRWDTIEIEK